MFAIGFLLEIPIWGFPIQTKSYSNEILFKIRRGQMGSVSFCVFGRNGKLNNGPTPFTPTPFGLSGQMKQ